MQLIEPQSRNVPPETTAIASLDGVSEAILALIECMQACLACADACTADPVALRRCIRLDQDCAAICQATLSVLSRSTEPDWRIVGAQLQTCIIACDACAEECELHTLEHPACRVCAEACRSCERACAWLVGAVADIG